MRRTVVALLAAVVALVMAVPVGAETTEFVPELVEQRTYLLCDGGNKIQNESTPVAWSTDAPSASYNSGAGCGFADPGPWGPGVEEATGELVLAGTYTGNLDTLSVHLHAIDGAFSRTGVWPMYVISAVEVDGNVIFDSGAEMELEPLRSESGITALGEYTITNIGLLEEADLTEHEVVIRVKTAYDDDFYGWVWGATEIDSGVTFNPAKISGTRVRATG